VFNHWVTILLTIAAVGSAIGTIFGWFRSPIRWFRSRTKSKVRQKGISLSFVSKDFQCQWGEASSNNQSGTFISGHWNVTNNSESNVVVLKARLSKHESRFVQVLTRHPNDERSVFSNNYPVLSHQMSEVSAAFTIFPPIGRAPKPIISDVIFTDNFGNEYRMRTKFTYIRSPIPSPSLWSRWSRR